MVSLDLYYALPLLIWNLNNETDCDVKWGSLFSIDNGVASLFQAEVRALLEGMLLAWDRGFGSTKVESVKAMLIDLILAGQIGSNMITEVRQVQIPCNRIICFFYTN